MAVEIKSWRDGKVLYTAKNAVDVREAVQEAVREKADLRYANLRYADLRYANLRYANLGSANLGYANLGYANLRSAKGVQPERVNDLLMLLDQVKKIRMYKLVDADYMSPIHNQGRLKYEIGSTVKVKEPNTDPLEDCGAGINLATLPWCLTNWQPGHRVLVMEFTAKDVAAIPVGDGKFRVSKAKVIREIPQGQVHGWLGLNPGGSVVTKEGKGNG